MVKKDTFVYLFIGEDANSKDAQISRLKEQFLSKKNQEFNSDTLYATDTDLTLKSLQEKLLFLPLDSQKRLVVIKNAQDLSRQLKEFLIQYAKKPQEKIILIIDMDRYDLRDEFVKTISFYAQTVRFAQSYQPSVFELNKQINLKKTAASLRLLNQLLLNGQKPELILGALRASWEKYLNNPPELKRRIKFLLQCDVAIKTGALKANFALERLIVNLCGLKNFTG